MSTVPDIVSYNKIYIFIFYYIYIRIQRCTNFSTRCGECKECSLQSLSCNIKNSLTLHSHKQERHTTIYIDLYETTAAFITSHTTKKLLKRLNSQKCLGGKMHIFYASIIGRNWAKKTSQIRHQHTFLLKSQFSVIQKQTESSLHRFRYIYSENLRWLGGCLLKEQRARKKQKKSSVTGLRQRRRTKLATNLRKHVGGLKI